MEESCKGGWPLFVGGWPGSRPSNNRQRTTAKLFSLHLCPLKLQNNTSMQGWKEYQAANKDRFLNELLDLLRIPSVSARSENKTEMAKCAEAGKQRRMEEGAH